MEPKKIVIGHLFPDLLNMYSDAGNIKALQMRLLWRGIEAEVRSFYADDEIDISGVDILFVGGGSDREQRRVLDKLLPLREKLLSYVEAGGVMLAVCGAYPMVGKTCVLSGETVEGLGLVNIYSTAGEKRVIGNVVIESSVTGESMTIVGFENHSSMTHLEDNTPLGRLLCGHGNNDADDSCGIVYKNLIGTYLHGPLLPKNPKLTDYLITKALQKKYGEEVTLAPFCDKAEETAHAYAVKRFVK
ncbi:MAG: glutamine amidotransferase [Ruminococcaceae bacterium]|nr:glutamine amidotransferase [Oscillospiraceae bacterium]